MKKSRSRIIGGTALALGVLSAPSAFAQQKDLTITLGLKLWGNTWQTATAFGPFANGGSNAVDTTAPVEWSAIPSLTVKWRDFFVSGGYYTKTTYDFPASTQLLFTPAGAGPTPGTFQYSADRKEGDLNFGYYFFPGVAVSLGYKQVDQTYRATWSPAAFSANNSTTTTKNKTATVGLQGSARLGNTSWFIYGNGAVSPGNTLKASFSGGGGSYKGWYASSELGFGYGLPNGITLTLGAKYQILDVEANNIGTNQRLRDITSGFIGGVAYTF